jgi:hypothetical protein
MLRRQFFFKQKNSEASLGAIQQTAPAASWTADLALSHSCRGGLGTRTKKGPWGEQSGGNARGTEPRGITPVVSREGNCSAPSYSVGNHGLRRPTRAARAVCRERSRTFHGKSQGARPAESPRAREAPAGETPLLPRRARASLEGEIWFPQIVTTESGRRSFRIFCMIFRMPEGDRLGWPPRSEQQGAAEPSAPWGKPQRS